MFSRFWKRTQRLFKTVKSDKKFNRGALKPEEQFQTNAPTGDWELKCKIQTETKFLKGFDEDEVSEQKNGPKAEQQRKFELFEAAGRNEHRQHPAACS